MTRKILTLLLCIAMSPLLGSCGDDWTHHAMPDYQKPEPKPEPDPDPDPEVKPEKEKMLWLDASANIKRFTSQANIRHFLDIIATTGFNKIVVDVKPTQGDVLYQSQFMTPVTQLNGEAVDISWDYLKYFLEQAKLRNLKVTVSTTFFPMGKQAHKSGEVYRDAKWDGKTCMQYTPSGMLDIKDDPTKVAAFLNPALPEVQEYLLRMVTEITTNYDFDAFALDYCRYPDAQSDFSQATRQLFESYLGEKVANFPADIFTYNAAGGMVPGKYYAQWWAFRAKVVRDFVAKVRQAVKAAKPNVKIEYWAASWWHAIYGNGQNWASPSYDPRQEGSWDWVSQRYGEGGFADQLDTFLLGSYLNIIYDPNNASSIEYAINRAYRLVGKDCAVYGTVSCASRDFDIEEAVYACLMRSEGMMVFDIVHVIGNQMWDKIKAGIDRAEKELGIQPANKKEL